MCSSKPPRIVQVAPDPQVVARQEQQLQTYQQQAAAQQAAMAEQLQQQIDAANNAAAAQRQQLEAARVAAEQTQRSQMAGYQASVSTMTPAQTEQLVGAQTTEAQKPKAKPSKSLKIEAGSTLTTTGAGLNIGV